MDENIEKIRNTWNETDDSQYRLNVQLQASRASGHTQALEEEEATDTHTQNLISFSKEIPAFQMHGIWPKNSEQQSSKTTIHWKWGQQQTFIKRSIKWLKIQKNIVKKESAHLMHDGLFCSFLSHKKVLKWLKLHLNHETKMSQIDHCVTCELWKIEIHNSHFRWADSKALFKAKKWIKCTPFFDMKSGLTKGQSP